MTLQATYLLPLALRPGDGDVHELASYLRAVAGVVDQVLVVDGSASGDRQAHAATFGPSIQVVAPRPELRTAMGKVGGVLTGLEHARHERVVVADDDVRYDGETLAAVLGRLEEADVVRPCNYFDPLPWHARWDTARTLLALVGSGDWPGTLAVRRSALLRCNGYSGQVMFENFELVRTVRAGGGTESHAPDILVR
nr:glycosyltransferase [Acidimicrobiia bacterium]